MEELNHENNTKTEKKFNSSHWKKGKPSPNPKGAPIKELRLSTLIDKALNEMASIDVSTREGYEQIVSFRQVLAKKLVRQAVENEQDLPYIKEILDRTEGKAPQTTDITSNGETLGMVIYKPQQLTDPDEAI